MLINDRFYVDPLRNEVTDKRSGKLDHVEPRLMKLLCLLAAYGGKPVSRKMIVKEIWNDYPGGDEGLNQAISVLRKLLNDDEKRIIETLPKTGYCFHGRITRDQIVLKRKSFKVIYALAALLLLLIVALTLGYVKYRANDRVVPARLSHEEAVRAFKIDSKGKLDSKQSGKAVKMDSLSKLDSKKNVKGLKMDSLGKLDRKENGQLHNTDKEKR